MDHSFRKDDFTYLEVDLFVFEDINLLYPPADTHILEYIYCDVDNSWLTWTWTLVHIFNNKIIILHLKRLVYIRATDLFATIRVTIEWEAFWSLRFLKVARWRGLDTRDIWSWLWPSFRCISGGRNVCRGCGRVGSLLYLWPGRLSKSSILVLLEIYHQNNTFCYFPAFKKVDIPET